MAILLVGSIPDLAGVVAEAEGTVGPNDRLGDLEEAPGIVLHGAVACIRQVGRGDFRVDPGRFVGIDRQIPAIGQT